MSPEPSEKERLKRLFDQDQAGRLVERKIDYAPLGPAQAKAAFNAVWREIMAYDLKDQTELKAMTPKSGWFPISSYGRDGATTAFLIVQHAMNDPSLMRSTLASMDRLRRSGEADGASYALLYDRVALAFDHRPQRYGSQVECRNSHWRPERLEAPAHVDARRKAVGLTQTEAEYLTNFAEMPCH